jgi:Transposase, Mutator family
MTVKKGKAEIGRMKELLAGDDEFIRSVVRAALQEVLEAEMTEAVGAGKGERTLARLGYRSGYYSRTLITRVGKLELRVPQDRDGRFSTELFERYQRSEKALVAALAEMYVQGVSTRKVKAIPRVRPKAGPRTSTEDLCGHSFSASSLPALGPALGRTPWDQRDQQATGREPGAVRASAADRGLSLSDPRCPLRAGPRGRRHRQAGGAGRHRHRSRRPPPGPRRRAGQPREPVELAGLPARPARTRSAGSRVRRRRRPCREGGDL